MKGKRSIMKNLLNYQSSEYDCGPVSLTNAVRFLFEREDIYPDIIKYIVWILIMKRAKSANLALPHPL